MGQLVGKELQGMDDAGDSDEDAVGTKNEIEGTGSIDEVVRIGETLIEQTKVRELKNWERRGRQRSVQALAMWNMHR
jgi:hypothetical protein